jgi:multiple sugar transport system permease protein
MPAARARAFLVLPLLLLVAPFLLWPVLSGFLGSVTDYSPFQPRPHFVGLANFTYVLSDGQFLASFRTVGLFTLVTVFAELLLGFAIAWLLREPFRGRDAVRVVLLIPWLVGPIANGVMWHFLFSSDNGILGYFLAVLGRAAPPSPLGLRGLALPSTMLAEVWQKTPLVTFLLYPGILSLPSSLTDQAVMEGASAPVRLWHVILPWLRPLFLAICLLFVGSALGAFDVALMLTGGGPGTETLTPALYSYRMAFQSNNWSAGATSAWFIVAAVILLGAAYLLVIRRDEAE